MGIEVGYFVVSRAFKKEFSSLNHEEFLWVYTSRENYSVFYRPECRISSPPFRQAFPPGEGGGAGRGGAAGAGGTPKGLITTRTTTNTSP